MMVRLFTLSTFVLSLFLLVGSQPVCSQNWDIVSTLDNYEAEGWYIYSPPRTEATLTQNADGTVTITRLNQNSSTIYMTHDVAWDESNGFTYEFRVRVDAIGGQWGGTDEHWDRASIYPLKNNPDGTWPTFSNGRTWLCSFDQTSIGSRYFANPFLPKADVDFTQFHVITFVCELDEGILADKLANEPDVSYGDSFDEGVIGRALGDHSPWWLYVDRNFTEPAVEEMPGSGWNGWGPPSVDADGIMQIGFQGTTRGQITVDYFRTGNGVILDPNEPRPAVNVSNWSIY